jgi:hypothetical protein
LYDEKSIREHHAGGGRMATHEDVVALAASVWPEASDITVRNDSPASGLVLLAKDAQGGIIQRLQAGTLDELQAEVEKMRQSKGKVGG